MVSAMNTYFDLRSGVFAAVLMGAVVWWINADHGYFAATTAASKQAAYTFFMGGLIVRLCHYLAGRPVPAGMAIAMATVLPTLVTTGATLLLHSLKGTPEPLLSTIPVAVISPPTFLLLAWQQWHTVRQLNQAGPS